MKLCGYGGCCKAMQCLEHWSDEVWTAEWRNLMLDFRIFEKAESLWGCEGPQGFDSIRFDSILSPFEFKSNPKSHQNFLKSNRFHDFTCDRPKVTRFAQQTADMCEN